MNGIVVKVNSYQNLNLYKPVPKRQVISEEFWYVNAGLLPDSYFDRALVFVGTNKLKGADLRFVLFLGVKFLIHYIELFSFDNTPLLIECISKHIKYLEALLGKQKKSKQYLSYRYIDKLRFVFESLQSVEYNNYVCRQIYIDQLERFCCLFSSRLKIWIRNSQLQAYLIRYGFDPYRSSAIYNSFLIPNERKYIDPLCRVNQKFIEKMGLRCKCKIILSVESTECYLFPEFITLEVIFDLYHGNYVGFIEMFGYIIKQLNPTQYFVKSCRTIIIEGAMLYNILSDVPVRKLKYLEKTVIPGVPCPAFLSINSISKQFLNIVEMIREEENRTVEVQSVETSKLEDSDSTSIEADFEFSNKNYYKTHSTETELMKHKQQVDHLNYSHFLLKYFQEKYDEEMKKINLEQQKLRKKIVSDMNKTKKNKLLPHDDAKEEKKKSKYTQKYIAKIHKALPEMDLEKEFNEIDEITGIKNKSNKTLPKDEGRENSDDFDPIYKEIISAANNNEFPNGNNVAVENNIYPEEDLIDFVTLSPSEQFSILLNETINVYSDETSWINHQMRLMIRCNTEQTIEDLKNPYLFEKRTIKDRLLNRNKCRGKFQKPSLYNRSYSNIPKLTSKTTTGSSNPSWISLEANQILSNHTMSEDIDYSHSSESNELEILNVNDLSKELPDVAKYLRKFDMRLTDTFISRKLFRKQNWINFLEQNLDFQYSREIEIYKLCNTEDIYMKVYENHTERIENYSDSLRKRIYALLILLTNNKITDKNFTELLEGQGINFPIVNKINKSKSSLPTFIGNLEKIKKKDYVGNLSKCLCQLMYDLIHLGYECSRELFYIMKTHLLELNEIIKNINDEDIQSAFRTLNIVSDLSKFNMKSYISGMGPNLSMLYLAEEMSLLHDIIFKNPCCSYKIHKHLGIHIIYHSMQLDDRLNAVEPFLKLPGDRRIRKIEKMCNCLITLRTGQHPIVPMNQYFVDIYYDFESGNHFGAMELIKQMMINQQKSASIKDHRTLIAYPSGELWAFRDTKWLKKCYNTNLENCNLADLVVKGNEKENTEE